MLGGLTQNEVPPTPPPDGTRGWIRRHPIWAGTILLLCLAMLDLALLPFGTLLSYRTETPRVTAFQQADLDRQAASGVRKPAIRKTWTPYSRIPKHLVRAVLVSEDAMFWQHSGFDTYEIQQSITDAVTEGRDLRGASTITQQLVKNLFLSSSRDPLRKLHESLLTVAAEQGLGKRRILELYLNEIEWGPGVYGAAAAAQHYFDEPLESLTTWQAAFLASIIPSPTRYAPDRMTPYLRQRIARTMRRIGAGQSSADSADVLMPAAPEDSVTLTLPDSIDGLEPVQPDTTA